MIEKGITYRQLSPLLISTFNNMILRRSSELIHEKVISERQILENVVFFNMHADDAYNS